MLDFIFSKPQRPRKIFFFDVETTGLTPGFHEICQFAGILDVDGETVWEYEKIIRPQFPCRIDPGAVAVHGITLDKMMGGIKQDELHYRIVKHLSFSVDKYNREDKAFPAAFNGNFDYSFMSSLFRARNDHFMGSLFNHRVIDPLAYFRFLNSVYDWKLENMKLSTIARAMGIKIDAHDAMSDTRALRELYYILTEDMEQ
jgi:DNA polymerase III epsilon subunit-like protein